MFAQYPFAHHGDSTQATAAPRAAQNFPAAYGCWWKRALQALCGLPPQRRVPAAQAFWEAKLSTTCGGRIFTQRPRDTVLLQRSAIAADLPYSQYNAYHKFIITTARYGPGPRALLTKAGRHGPAACRICSRCPLPAIFSTSNGSAFPSVGCNTAAKLLAGPATSSYSPFSVLRCPAVFQLRFIFFPT